MSDIHAAGRTFQNQAVETSVLETVWGQVWHLLIPKKIPLQKKVVGRWFLKRTKQQSVLVFLLYLISCIWSTQSIPRKQWYGTTKYTEPADKNVRNKSVDQITHHIRPRLKTGSEAQWQQVTTSIYNISHTAGLYSLAHMKHDLRPTGHIQYSPDCCIKEKWVEWEFQLLIETPTGYSS